MKIKHYNSATEEVYSELQVAYDVFNAELFQQQLPACLITMQSPGTPSC